MSVEEIMTSHGFNLSASCAGKATFTKWIKYNGKRAYITVNDQGGEGFPTSLEEPVRVTTHDLRSGDELEAPVEISSLSSYLESLSE
ncbi:MAG: hypothetical protein P8168_13555 [Deltaproteobacteria bacterium]|jgi:hypothetical protein